MKAAGNLYWKAILLSMCVNSTDGVINLAIHSYRNHTAPANTRFGMDQLRLMIAESSFRTHSVAEHRHTASLS